MEKIKLIVVDDNVELVSMIKEYFSGHADISVVGTAKDGEEGMKLIRNVDSWRI